jgi:hypothetical protein
MHAFALGTQAPKLFDGMCMYYDVYSYICMAFTRNVGVDTLDRFFFFRKVQQIAGFHIFSRGKFYRGLSRDSLHKEKKRDTIIFREKKIKGK